ncbi:GNAT family N-acetyltransferase [Ornithinibacillus gellani]|uniref:GNAT family N-acetyltransferase n=1 Tax=Ornithinibacillus gellani TaxID=2293253 RepID=UPI000F4909BD|nr:GNAT family protein [Ornithinibacillus gellani]TQS74187.1 GNAT family N-acetyltransferase [Ornithinibacillus gellani]
MLFHTIIQDGYWLVDQNLLHDKSAAQYEAHLTKLIADWRETNAAYLSLLMVEQQEKQLIAKGFQKVSRIVEYTRDLQQLEGWKLRFSRETLASGQLSEAGFMDLYERCRSGSLNKNKRQPIAQAMQSIQDELGKSWRSSCMYFLEDEKPVGISIPHIESGTSDEGRMFYFGVIPERRGEGIGAEIHRETLQVLANMGASYYVGSTDAVNEPMIQIMKKNGCTLRQQKGIYHLNRTR